MKIITIISGRKQGRVDSSIRRRTSRRRSSKSHAVSRGSGERKKLIIIIFAGGNSTSTKPAASSSTTSSGCGSSSTSSFINVTASGPAGTTTTTTTSHPGDLEELQSILHFPEEVALRLTDAEYQLFYQVRGTPLRLPHPPPPQEQQQHHPQVVHVPQCFFLPFISLLVCSCATLSPSLLFPLLLSRRSGWKTLHRREVDDTHDRGFTLFLISSHSSYFKGSA